VWPAKAGRTLATRRGVSVLCAPSAIAYAELTFLAGTLSPHGKNPASVLRQICIGFVSIRYRAGVACAGTLLLSGGSWVGAQREAETVRLISPGALHVQIIIRGVAGMLL
jgi:hypothetical protein